MNRHLLALSVMLLVHASCTDPDFGRTAFPLTGITTDALPAIPVCGNAMVENGEECDDGNTRNDDGCSRECKYEYCGDGVVQKPLGEECDDGGYRNDDGCDMFCQIERPPVDAGVPRDAPPPPPVDAPPPPRDAPPPPPMDAPPPPPMDAPPPPPMDAPPPVCGNGRVEHGEECDDGNTSNNDGCNSECKYEYCGDGVVQMPLGEQCDDGGYRNDDGCDMFCQIERPPSALGAPSYIYDSAVPVAPQRD
jgi:cysteine-rich repeat protein